MSESTKTHVSVVIVGHVDSGKSTTTGRLLFELGGISQREMAKLKEEAARLGKDSFCFAFFTDKQKEERERGITISCTTKEFFTDNYHYTIIDAPGHRDFIKNMISGASQADVGVIMVPADGNFITALAKGDHKSGEVQGQTRQHARLLNLLGVKQIIVCVNKMDSDTAAYKQERFEEVKNEMVSTLVRVGWPKAFVDASVPIIPISGWKGDNLIAKSENMPWWSGVDVKCIDGSTVHVNTLLESLNNMVKIPKREFDKPMRAPVSGCFKIKGVGDVVTARIEQGTVKPGDEVVFIPKHTTTTSCGGKVFTVEMHHKAVPSAGPGDNIGLNIKGLPPKYLPDNGDIMILKTDQSISRCKTFVMQAMVLDHPGEIKVGYCPVGYVRTAHAALKIAKINWKISKETGKERVEEPPYIKVGDTCELVMEPQQAFVVEEYSKSDGLSRVALMDGGNVVMIGKVIKVEY